jgi:hypothetical protein
LKPGGKAIVMMYAESSSHYWRELVGTLGLKRDLLKNHSMGEIMSRYVEISQNDARPLVKVYTASRLKHLFEGFDRRDPQAPALPASCRRGSSGCLGFGGRLFGWNVIIRRANPPRDVVVPTAVPTEKRASRGAGVPPSTCGRRRDHPLRRSPSLPIR